ncbi:MAG: TIR domain-containing protein [Planctomycetaceae bacterium]|nr:TIR domain-containing protein [Planctomycetaceae bacterium]
MAATEVVSALGGVRTRSDVANLLATSDAQLRYLLYGRHEDSRYCTFRVPKRKRGFRTIEAPREDLKLLQRRLVVILSAIYQPRAGVHGFTVGRSIVTNARQHCGRRYVLNVDLKDFFTSINFGRVFGLFRAPPISASYETATVLAQLCCHRNVLPQGAPTSPIVSNMICARLDRQLSKLAQRNWCRFTRYADDITFSKQRGEFPEEIGYLDREDVAQPGSELRRIIEANGFAINPSKVSLRTKKRSQSVTGLTVNEKCNVHRNFVRQVRAMIHSWQKFGFDAAHNEHTSRYYRRLGKLGNPPRLDQIIRGKLAFVRMVRGGLDPVYKNLQLQLCRVDPSYLDVMRKENDRMKRRDVFLSHASEDKETLVRPLADSLIAAGISVWYDEYEIQLGDSLREKIDEGLAKSRFGVVVLSRHFFSKRWPRRELDGLTAREDASHGNMILPVWHGLSKADVAGYSPTLAGLKALLTDGKPLAEVAVELVAQLRGRLKKTGGWS